jgi:hypothetical protein
MLLLLVSVDMSWLKVRMQRAERRSKLVAIRRDATSFVKSSTECSPGRILSPSSSASPWWRFGPEEIRRGKGSGRPHAVMAYLL